MPFHLSLLASRLHNCYNEDFFKFTAQSIPRICLVVKYLYYLNHYLYETNNYFAMILLKIFFFRDAALRAYQGVMTLPRFCGDRKHNSDGIRVAKAEPLSASFSTTSARKRDSFASILNEGCTRPKRWLPCRQNGDVAHIYQILPCAKASLLIQYWRNCAATCS